MPIVEKRYAKALIDVALTGGNSDVFQKELQYVVDIFNNQSDFKCFFLNPEVKNEIKKDTVKKLFDGKLKPEMVNFLLLLLDKGRINLLNGINKEYSELADKMKNILYMTIVSAVPLEEVQIGSIKEKYRRLHNSTAVKAELVVDKSLIGGIKVKIGDKLIDGSVKGRLEGLKQLIVEG
ncbi:MAG: F0F1 ATP synthase subunit delta [Clostridia bacterium]|nr:F0F1 ATP synthase subunit delta [Clostridia bacterium]